jgi:glycosyltransferase involved in cell wall biosynthesis
MSNDLPIIVSSSPMFDDLDGVVPRPTDAQSLSATIEEFFSSEKFQTDLLARQRTYINDNTWEKTALRYKASLEAAVNRCA